MEKPRPKLKVQYEELIIIHNLNTPFSHRLAEYLDGKGCNHYRTVVSDADWMHITTGAVERM